MNVPITKSNSGNLQLETWCLFMNVDEWRSKQTSLRMSVEIRWLLLFAQLHNKLLLWLTVVDLYLYISYIHIIIHDYISCKTNTGAIHEIHVFITKTRETKNIKLGKNIRHAHTRLLIRFLKKLIIYRL